MKKGVSLLITTIFIVIVSIIGLMILSFSGSSITHTTRSFLDIRAELMLKSATEYAILALHGHKFDVVNKCLNSINLSDNLFDVNITFHYFVTDCNNLNIWKNCKCSTIYTADTNGSVLIYVSVTSKNRNFYIRKTRFTLQNI